MAKKEVTGSQQSAVSRAEFAKEILQSLNRLFKKFVRSHCSNVVDHHQGQA
jgi:hypothetical protein